MGTKHFEYDVYIKLHGYKTFQLGISPELVCNTYVKLHRYETYNARANYSLQCYMIYTGFDSPLIL